MQTPTDFSLGESQLLGHGGQQSGTDFLAAILHHGLAVAEVEHEMAALAALPVDPNRHAPLAPDGHDTVDELASFHGSRIE